MRRVSIWFACFIWRWHLEEQEGAVLSQLQGRNGTLPVSCGGPLHSLTPTPPPRRFTCARVFDTDLLRCTAEDAAHQCIKALKPFQFLLLLTWCYPFVVEGWEVKHPGWLQFILCWRVGRLKQTPLYNVSLGVMLGNTINFLLKQFVIYQLVDLDVSELSRTSIPAAVWLSLHVQPDRWED